MSNCIFLQVGQCGNQLGQEILNLVYAHHNAHKTEQEGKQHRETDTIPDPDDHGMQILFRSNEENFSANSAGASSRWTARAVCVDTEPKVVLSCMEATKQQQQPRQFSSSKRASNLNHQAHYMGWGYDLAGVAYRHGGAGNNWALGYKMAGGGATAGSQEFLQQILDGCLRREIERCDNPTALCIIHSIAGGTGSGLGARLTEELSDVMSDLTRINIAVAPYHIGEVVVQHYNTVLSLAALSRSSDAVLVFENQAAQLLCRQMSGIERPRLTDVNRVIASNLLPIFLPKVRVEAGPLGLQRQSRCHLVDEVIRLCGHPGLRFLDVKLTPQTAAAAVQHTYDSHSTLFKTIAAMQMSGSPSERLIATAFKHSTTPTATAPPWGPGQAAFSSPSPPPPLPPPSSPSPSISSPPSSSASASAAGSCLVKTAASSLCFHGDEAAQAAQSLAAQIDAFTNTRHANASHSKGAHPAATSPRRGVGLGSSPTPFSPSVQHGQSASNINISSSFPFLEEYLRSHTAWYEKEQQGSSSFHSGGGRVSIEYSEGSHRVNGYHRSASILSNSQAILPLLQRSTAKAQDLYLSRAYVHQYESHGLEDGDFLEAFRTIGAVVHNYCAL